MHLTPEEFERAVAEGVDAIPERFLSAMRNVVVVVEDEPTPAQSTKMRLRSPNDLLGLYEGIPQTERAAGYAGVVPDRITIFRGAIEASARDADEVRRIVRDTVWHEVAHHFGMDERRVRRAEANRARRCPRCGGIKS